VSPGYFAAVLLVTAVGIAAPLFIIMLVIVFIPWLMWGFVIRTERLHGRNKSVWWLLLFYSLPALLGPLAKSASFAGGTGVALQHILMLAGLALSVWGFVEIGCLPGNPESNGYRPNPILQAKRAGRSS
jgi:uncharacterized membrane protein YhaH (DUF805 family)